MKTLKLGTWNLFNGSPFGISLVSDNNRINQIIDNLEKENFDIIGLQELNNLSLLNCLKKKLGSKYKFFYCEKNLLIPNIILFVFLFILLFFIHDITYLCLIFLFANFILRNSTIYNFLMEDIRSGLVILVNNKLNTNNYSLNYHAFKCQNGDYLNFISERGFLKLKINLSEKINLIIYNTHLNCNNKFNFFREYQIKELYQDTIKHQKKDKQIILGDFNTHNQVNELKILNEDFKDSLEGSILKSWDINNPFTNELLMSKCTKLKNEGRIDYIFYKNFKKISSDIIFNCSKTLCSDHYAIRCILHL